MLLQRELIGLSIAILFVCSLHASWSINIEGIVNESVLETFIKSCIENIHSSTITVSFIHIIPTLSTGESYGKNAGV